RHTRSKRDWSSDVCSSDLAVQDRCRTTEPALIAEFGDGREVACHRADEIVAGTLKPSDIFPRPPHEERTIKESDTLNPVVRAQRSEERRVGKEVRAGG